MRKGFTLIELLVVVLIIGILAAVALPQYQKSVRKTKLAESLILLKAVVDSEKRYLLAHEEGTKQFADLDIDLPGTITKTNNAGETMEVGHTIVQVRTDYTPFGANVSLKGETNTMNIRYDHSTDRIYCTIYKTNPGDAPFCAQFGPAVTCPPAFGSLLCYGPI